MSSAPAVTRWVRWFEKDADRFVGEAELSGVSLTELQRIFGVAADNSMYDCWPIRAKHVSELTPYLSTQIELDRFDYFVEADAASG